MLLQVVTHQWRIMKMLLKLLNFIKKKKLKNKTLGRPAQVADYTYSMDNFTRSAQNSLYYKRCNNAISDYTSRQNDTIEDLSQLEARKAQEFNDFDEQIRNRKNKLSNRQNEEWNEHLKEKPIETPANFRRRSSYLLDKMGKERRLFYQGRLEEAAVIRSENEKLDNEEGILQQEQAYQNWILKGNQLQNKFAKENEIMDQWIETRKLELEGDLGKQKESLEKRKRHLDCEIISRKQTCITADTFYKRRSLVFEPRSRPCIQIKKPYNVVDLSLQLSEKSREILLKIGNK